MSASSSSSSSSPNDDQQQSFLPPGTIIPSPNFLSGRSVVIQDEPRPEEAKLVEERTERDYEYVTVARPVDYVQKIYEVPTTRVIQTLVPQVQVREVVRTIPKDEPRWVEKEIEVPHQKVVDRYVEVPVVSGTEVKYVPKVEVRERTIQTSRPEVKWVEKVVEVPQVKEVVRYVESDSNVETVIRYVPKGKDDAYQPGIGGTGQVPAPPTYPRDSDARDIHLTSAQLGQMMQEQQGRQADEQEEFLTPKTTIPIGGEGSYMGSLAKSLCTCGLPPSPRLEEVEQLLIPRVSKTVEVEKAMPVSVDVPVPFMVPKPVSIPVEVPVLRFRDHFVPVPVRRHVIPKIIFTDDVYEVECVREKPYLVIEDYNKPVAVDVKIKLKEKDIRVVPVDPAEMTQADIHAMWMRVNADLLDKAKQQGNNPEVMEALRQASGRQLTTSTSSVDFEEKLGEPLEDREQRLKKFEGEREARRMQKRREKSEKAAAEDASVGDPDSPPETEEEKELEKLGPIPLHPGHPLMMTFLQNQWIQNPSTATHNMYGEEYFRLHASALDGIMHPQPHQVNLTQQQSAQIGPMPSEVMPFPWNDLRNERTRASDALAIRESERELFGGADQERGGPLRKAACMGCCPPGAGCQCCSSSC